MQDHGDGKWDCLRRTAVKVALWPFTILLGVWDALSHIVYEEPLDYRAAPSGAFNTVLDGERMNIQLLALSPANDSIFKLQHLDREIAVRANLQ